LLALLNSAMNLPQVRASSGNFLGPNKMSAKSMMKKISPEKPKSIVLSLNNTAAFLKNAAIFH
jgi:hypothetical protein